MLNPRELWPKNSASSWGYVWNEVHVLILSLKLIMTRYGLRSEVNVANVCNVSDPCGVAIAEIVMI